MAKLRDLLRKDKAPETTATMAGLGGKYRADEKYEEKKAGGFRPTQSWVMNGLGGVLTRALKYGRPMTATLTDEEEDIEAFVSLTVQRKTNKTI